MFLKSLNNNIDFLIAALAIAIIVYVIGRKRFRAISKANENFYRFTFTMIIACIADIFLNICKTYTNLFPFDALTVFRFMYNVSFILMLIFAYRFILSYILVKHPEKKHFVSDYIIYGSAGLFIVLSIVNLFTGVLTYSDANGNYQTGPLYFLTFTVPALIILTVAAVSITFRDSFTKQQFNGIIALTFLTSSFTIVEMLIESSILLCMFASSFALLILQLALETPDYFKLINAIDELEQSKKIADEARIEADMANRAKSEFLARMSHEIRTPMNAIMGMNEIIIRESTDASAISHAQNAYNAADNLLGIINDILDFSKIESGKMNIVEDEYSLRQLIKDEWGIFVFKAEEKNLKLEFVVDDALPDGLYGDNLRIKQVITNLLSNAIKYTDEGTVTVSVKEDKREDNHIFVRFAVTDTGIGIRKNELDKLFDAFARLDEKKNRNVEGTGLGMNIVAQLLHLMNSNIEVESTYGVGSSFSFVLEQEIRDYTPIGDLNTLLESSPQHRFEKTELFNAEKVHILAVDDLDMNLIVFKTLLRATKANIVTATSGAEAIKYTKDQKFDLIFLDHFMPQMDGVETLKIIKSQEDGKNKETPIIVLTANAVKDAYDDYIAMGFDDVSYKPTTQDDLNAKLIKFIK